MNGYEAVAAGMICTALGIFLGHWIGYSKGRGDRK